MQERPTQQESSHDAGVVAVFAKPPVPGLVKTRLGATIGHTHAARLAAAFLQDTWRTVSDVSGLRPVVASTSDTLGLVLDPRPVVWSQGAGDLGARMERVIRRGLTEAPFVIVIGADVPAMPRRRLTEAEQQLRSGETDVVLGPADDGGFYLIAASVCPTGMLSDIPWSQPDTLQHTLDRLRSQGLRVSLLPPCFDVDEPEDLERLRTLLRVDASRAPATWALLSQPSISVVVPTLDEGARIRRQLDWLQTQDLHEIIVADGGSEDGTQACSTAFFADNPTTRGRLVVGKRGRARQMNLGAESASGDVLLFVHADVKLPPDATRHVREALESADCVGGAFRTWTVDDTGQSRLGPLLHLADFRSRYSRYPYGDQCLFVRRHVFDAIGGFPDLPLMEDLEFSMRLTQAGRVEVVPASVEVSGRRFIARPFFYTALVNIYPALYRAGVPARWLDRFYRAVR